MLANKQKGKPLNMENDSIIISDEALDNYLDFTK